MTEKEYKRIFGDSVAMDIYYMGVTKYPSLQHVDNGIDDIKNNIKTLHLPQRVIDAMKECDKDSYLNIVGSEALGTGAYLAICQKRFNKPIEQFNEKESSLVLQEFKKMNPYRLFLKTSGIENDKAQTSQLDRIIKNAIRTSTQLLGNKVLKDDYQNIFLDTFFNAGFTYGMQTKFDMELFDFFKGKGNTEVWRDENGKITCPGDSCPKECDDTCPIWCATKAATYLQKLNNPYMAIQEYKKAIAIAPDFKDAWSNMASCYGSLDKHQEAYNCYKTAYELDHNYRNAIYGLIISCKNLSNYEEAMKYCDIYAQIFSQEEARNLRSQILTAQENNPNAKMADDMTMATAIIEQAKKIGIINKTASFKLIPELAVERKRVCATVHDALSHPIGIVRGFILPLGFVCSGAYAGIGAVIHWDDDWDSLKEEGIAETLLDAWEPDNMNSYVLNLLFDEDEQKAEEFDNKINELSKWVLGKYMKDPEDESQFQKDGLEIMSAMYIFGMVCQMDRMGMR